MQIRLYRLSNNTQTFTYDEPSRARVDQVQHPKFVYAEHESDCRFKARFKPKSDSIASTPSGLSTPDTDLVTPHSAGSNSTFALALKQDSPSLDHPIPRPSLKHRALDHGPADPPKKKKARVAFA